MALSLVPIPKNGVLLPTLGLPFERALSLHRKLGIASVLASLAHSAVYLWRWRDDLLMELNETLGISTVMVTHDPAIAARMDRAVRLVDGVLEPAIV